jgi:hypothetical protein
MPVSVFRYEYCIRVMLTWQPSARGTSVRSPGSEAWLGDSEASDRPACTACTCTLSWKSPYNCIDPYHPNQANFTIQYDDSVSDDETETMGPADCSPPLSCSPLDLSSWRRLALIFSIASPAPSSSGSKTSQSIHLLPARGLCFGGMRNSSGRSMGVSHLVQVEVWITSLAKIRPYHSNSCEALANRVARITVG